jgi:aspartyl aminopeptidase
LTAHGADSNFLPTVLKRLCSLSSKNGNSSATAFEESLSKSFLVSADMAHAVHPNYSNKYEDHHKPRLNQGVVLKVQFPSPLPISFNNNHCFPELVLMWQINANARYATNSPGMVLMDEVARRAGKNVTLQRFVVRNDSSCGSTIGPMLAAKLGLRYPSPSRSRFSVLETTNLQDCGYGESATEYAFVSGDGGE